MRWMVIVLLALGVAMAWSQDTGTGEQTTGISKSRSQDMAKTQLSRLSNPDTLFKPTVGYSQLGEMREIRDKYVDVANPPTSTFVVVKRLVRPEWLIEVEAVAAVKK